MALCLGVVAAGIAPLAAAQVAAAGSAHSCRAQSSAKPPQVIELYTSEGCSSCPPADRWLSSLKGRSDVLPLALHVTYWDRLGWPDRFASPEYTERQYAAAQRAGSRQVYTPQVMVDGRDWRGWPALPTAAAPAAPAPSVTLERQGGSVVAQVAASAGAKSLQTNLSGYWAVLENNHVSNVKAGENSGETLRHDHVVRLIQPLPAWRSSEGARFQIDVNSGVPEFPRRVVLVVTDAATQRPLQGLALGC